mmetsp:Transcript_62994/g.150041  ORF Transcript_62994/g.150041 Transcript_62994/m.150041 type:complete len:570 (+) Transcript_62994:150-1859(+)|eukprot:CAMPEP_0178445992 /NCGR_PEP_ID=MMETSP0689_2-20121128/40522_1 /TAXON_ID=160604 /ORGANISM="Amphidinium massartii, Strain CS-259" /LENGTH=569 /DNA_ID=CAMNT_0020070699 /DNA_START=127 /DNA_END=1836 /DNA_ORIENTATION=+
MPIAIHALTRCAIVVIIVFSKQSSALLRLSTASLKWQSSSDSQGGCARLANHETFFTVDVEVGTPKQSFSVVADTGSDSLIIPSCTCVETGHCNTGANEPCFQGTGRSSTFKIPSGPEGPPMAVLTFGSGAIKAAIASDAVTVGGVTTFMKQGVLLMTDQALDIATPFEGILGLGPPRKYSVGDLTVGDNTTEYAAAAARQPGSPMPAALGTQEAAAAELVLGPGHNAKSFLREAGVSHFSLCYNSLGDGALRLGTPPQANGMRSVGKLHWGLDFRGIKIGDATEPMAFCQPENMTEGQETACGGIPDSGTTVLAAPTEHLMMLVDGMCDGWERCSSQYRALQEAATQAHDAVEDKVGSDPWGIAPLSKTQVFLQLLDDCASWLPDSPGGLSELPTLHFQVGDLSGNHQTLDLPPQAYVLEMKQEDEQVVFQFSRGLKRQLLRRSTSNTRQQQQMPTATANRTVCAPAFEPMQYVTQKNGPVWILGMPFFYQYQVHYNLDPSNPTIAFSDSPCGACQGSTAAGASASEGNDPHGLVSLSPRLASMHPKRITKPLRGRLGGRDQHALSSF